MISKMYTPIIGLEIHVELRTESKMFCGCPADHFGKAPNSQTCPVCLGLPGALPYPNEKAIGWTAMIGLALNCKVNRESKFDRKHYFYPDLPKGYQISQYDEPLASDGSLEILNPKSKILNKIRIRRVHIEEDTGKLQHTTLNGHRLGGASGSESQRVSLVDFNRSGVALVEIVTEPDIHSASEAKEFAQKLQQILRYLGVSDCDMEKGSMRLEANVSLAKGTRQKALGTSLPDYKGVHSATSEVLPGDSSEVKLPDYKVEVKNINSFRFLEKAINYEIERQRSILVHGDLPRQETRGWSEAKNATISQRYKETEADYRYFPEPDIPPMEFTSSYIEDIRKQIPELPEDIQKRFTRRYGIRPEYAQILVGDKNIAKFTEGLINLAKKEKLNVNLVAGYLINQKIDINKEKPQNIILKLKKSRESKVSEEKILIQWVGQAIDALPQAASDYKKGKLNAISALIGYVMKISRGKGDASLVRKILEEKLK